ncbi:MAG: GNAT family N-acetyltransferase [Myxococcales bacterium]|nr:GNAT family N-acetyltransferase [Myxococcales bacterium]
MPAETPSENQAAGYLIRPAKKADRDALCQLVEAAGVFSAEEIATAQEIIDQALQRPALDNYQIVLAQQVGSDQVAGYACYARTPFTRAASDLYWLATHPQHRRFGIARQLIATMEAALAKEGIEHVRVETSGTGGYSAARSFYDRCGYQNIARIPDFYKPGDDLYTYYKRLHLDAA